MSNKTGSKGGHGKSNHSTNKSGFTTQTNNNNNFDTSNNYTPLRSSPDRSKSARKRL